MKKLFLLLTLITGAYVVHSQTLITYGNNTVSVDEFLRAYNKNKTPVADKERSLREYLDLYTNFKLKVQAANELRLDTLEQIKTDILNFRNQVEDNYMSDEKGRDALLSEAVTRSFKDLHIIHYYIPVDPAATPADTMKAFATINAAYDELQKGAGDISKLGAVKYSDVGFITVFSLPYQFENIVYALKPGETSKPYRSKSAWHMFRLVEARPSTGKWKVAQILFSISPTASADEKLLVKKRADSIYSLLLNGADFSILAKKFSEDKLTYMTGGELPEFTTGRYDYSFEKEILQLKSDGDISRPFLTPFGYHIVKRLGHTPAPMDKNDPTLLFDLKQKVLKDSRIEASKQKFSKEVTQKIGFKKTNLVKEADLMRYADSVIKNPVVENTLRFPISNKPIIKFNNGSVNASDWLKFVVEYKGNFNDYKGETNKELWDKYLTYAANEYYKDHMENYNEDFKYQMKEFKEGNMLFEIMERNVWGLASADSAGLIKHYNANKSKYIWPSSAEVLIFNCSNEKGAEDALLSLKNGKEWKKVADANTVSVQADSGRYELSQVIGLNNGDIPVAGSYSPIVKNTDGTATFVKYLHIYPAGQQRTFEEAKGLVINDYQNVLEERWLALLRKKYPVKVNEAALKSIVNK